MRLKPWPRNGREPVRDVELLAASAEPSDEVLVARVARRDTAAFALLYDRYARVVYTLALHLLGVTEAEEAVQEIFLRLWNKASQFDAARGAFGAWFMTLARHFCFDNLQRAHRSPLDIGDEIEQLLLRADTIDVEDQVMRRESGRAVLHALQRLPAEQRQVLVLSYFGGQSQSQIAQMLRLPLGTVKKRMRLGMQKLRVALLPAEEGARTNTSVERDGE